MTSRSAASPTTDVLRTPVELPCGLTLPNRLMKAAMSEALADRRTSDPTPALVRLYERWADGGAGTLVTGVMSVQRGVEDSVVVALDADTDIAAVKAWADAVHDRGVVLVGQLVHPGRQAPIHLTRHPVAPSALPPVRGSRLFGSSRALTAEEIQTLVDAFGTAAVILQDAGFDGVEIHAAHGYLIGQFLSPTTNLRTDDWGGDLSRRSRFLIEIVRTVRRRVGPAFAVAVKINASDFQPGGFDIDDSAHVVGLLDTEGVDLVEISGGTYESASGALGVRPGEPGTTTDAYFAGFAPRLRQVTSIPLALTGGIRTRQVMEQLISDGTVDVIGLGRPLVQEPDFPHRLLNGDTDRVLISKAPVHGLLELAWWTHQFRRLADGKAFDPHYTVRHLQRDTAAGLLNELAARARDTLSGTSTHRGR